MHCHSLLAFLVFLCLFISLTCCLVGLFSRHWWVGNFEVTFPVKRVNLTGTYDLHWLFGVNFGLWKICWRALQPKLTTDPEDYEIVEQLDYCVTEMPQQPVNGILQNREGEMDHFQNIYISLIVAIIFNMLAFSFAFYKLPCIRKYRRPLIVMTVIMSFISAVAAVIAIYIANDTLYFNAPFMNTLLSTRPYFGEQASPTVNFYLDQVFSTSSIVGSFDRLKDEFEKGFAFVVTCIALLCMILAIMFSVLEHCFLYRYYNGSEYIISDEPEDDHKYWR